MAIKDESPNLHRQGHKSLTTRELRDSQRDEEREREREKTQRAVRAKGIEMPSLVSPQTCDRGSN
jgi:hypothetical protein